MPNSPLRVEIVRGDPYHVAGRTLTPVARVVTFGQARGTVRRDRVEGWGGGLMWVTPRAVVEETPQGERTTAIVDTTGSTLWQMGVMALALTLVLTGLRWIVRRLRAGG
jgi:hypothetical protein